MEWGLHIMAERSTVAVYSQKKFQGSGVVVASQGQRLLLSAHHVCAGKKELIIENSFFKGQVIGVSYLNKTSDLFLGELEVSEDRSGLQQYAGPYVNYRNIPKNSALLLVGYPDQFVTEHKDMIERDLLHITERPCMCYTTNFNGYNNHWISVSYDNMQLLDDKKIIYLKNAGGMSGGALWGIAHGRPVILGIQSEMHYSKQNAKVTILDSQSFLACWQYIPTQGSECATDGKSQGIGL